MIYLRKSNVNLNTSRMAKNDEYYTKYEDITEEVDNYKDQLRGKVVYCNADNPYDSNFVKYFIDNFDDIGLKSLLTSN